MTEFREGVEGKHVKKQEIVNVNEVSHAGNYEIEAQSSDLNSIILFENQCCNEEVLVAF